MEQHQPSQQQPLPRGSRSGNTETASSRTIVQIWQYAVREGLPHDGLQKARRTLDHKDRGHKEVDMHTASYWSATHAFPEFPTINCDIEVDVVVVGAGLTGITTAYLLKQEGARVALIERDRVAAGDTSRTTAHLTYVTDTRLHQLATPSGKPRYSPRILCRLQKLCMLGA